MSYILETEQIHNAIARKIETAQSSIHVCVAWFTCKALATALQDRLKKVKVSIIISDHEFNAGLVHFKMLLRYPGCTLWILPTVERRLMHNKFCIIDKKTVLTGSYNWSDKAESNYENILICEDVQLANQYLSYFDKLTASSTLVKDASGYKRAFLSDIVFAEQERETSILAKDFEQDVLNNLEISRKYIKIKFDRILENISRYSAVGAARIYCNIPEIQSGLEQLKESKRFDLSFEWMVLQPKYASLFSNQTKNVARKKLVSCGYFFQ